jgi:hypothetical protein
MPLPGPGDCWDGREDAAPGPSAGVRDRRITLNDRQLGENARGAVVTGGKPTSCWILSTATERGDLRATGTVGRHPTLPK